MKKKGVNSAVPESKYPLFFREEDAQTLAEIIQRQESVCLVAMKKVGISTFVRFFAQHPEIKNRYFGQEKEKYLFVYCDLNDLLEISARSFWVLIFKRLTENLGDHDIPPRIKKQVDKLFLQAIPAVDPFFFFDNLKKSVEIIASESNLYLTLFLLRFDRLESIFSESFFANLQSLFDAAKYRFFYITTSVRPLPELCPEVFKSANLPLLASSYFLKPARRSDMETISTNLGLTKSQAPGLNKKIKDLILDLGGGHLVLTRLILIVWLGWNQKNQKRTNTFLERLLSDERINLACEEIWENLTPEEKNFLNEGLKGAWKPDQGVGYLFKTGILKRAGPKGLFFSPLFQSWVEKKLAKKPAPRIKEFTKKEELLFNFLLANQGEVCHRDEVIAAVWPEYQASDDLAVSDWAVDRLVARLRKKLKAGNDPHRILTIRGRGHKLLSPKT